MVERNLSLFILYVAACPIIMDDDVTNGRPVVGRMDSLETCATLNKHFFRFSRYLNIFIIDNRNLSVFSGEIGLARPLLLDFSACMNSDSGETLHHVSIILQ